MRKQRMRRGYLRRFSSVVLHTKSSVDKIRPLQKMPTHGKADTGEITLEGILSKAPAHMRQQAKNQDKFHSVVLINHGSFRLELMFSGNIWVFVQDTVRDDGKTIRKTSIPYNGREIAYKIFQSGQITWLSMSIQPPTVHLD